MKNQGNSQNLLGFLINFGTFQLKSVGFIKKSGKYSKIDGNSNKIPNISMEILEFHGKLGRFSKFVETSVKMQKIPLKACGIYGKIWKIF